MKKVFTTVLPDQPYKIDTKKNHIIECTYEGPRYLLLRIRESDGYVFCIDRETDVLENLEPFKQTEHQLSAEGMFQIVMDADVNTWEAAYLTGYYTHEPFDDYTETLVTGETYSYHYDDAACAVEQPFYINDLHYDKGTNSYKRPRYRVHAVNRADFLGSVEAQKKQMDDMIDNHAHKYDAAGLQSLKDYRAFLESIPTKYIAAGVDHWKIPYPDFPKMIF